MGGPLSVPLQRSVAPGQTVDISVDLKAPDAAGRHEGTWQLQSADGKLFGVGDAARDGIWVKVRSIPPAYSTATPNVPSPTSSATGPAPLSTGTAVTITPTAVASAVEPAGSAAPVPTQEVRFDLAASACAAQWQSNDGVLECPGLAGDQRGFVVDLSQAHLEDGTTTSLPTLLTFPQAGPDGYILGVYPEVDVQAGDHLQASVGCEQNATGCSVLFRVSYLDASSAPHDLWTLGEFYDGKYFNLDLDLGALAGQKVKLILHVSSLGSADGDRALWVAPRIVNIPVPTPTASITPTATLPPDTATASLTATLPPAVTLPPTPAPTAAPVPPSQPSFQQVVDSIVSFFRQLFGVK
jgi:hypothetical protein